MSCSVQKMKYDFPFDTSNVFACCYKCCIGSKSMLNRYEHGLNKRFRSLFIEHSGANKQSIEIAFIMCTHSLAISVNFQCGQVAMD